MARKAERESGAGHATEPMKRFLKAEHLNTCIPEAEMGTVLRKLGQGENKETQSPTITGDC